MSYILLLIYLLFNLFSTLCANNIEINSLETQEKIIEQLVVIGDSYSTGLNPEMFNLEELNVKKEIKHKPLWPVVKEYSSPFVWLLKHFWLATSYLYLSDYFQSWPRRLGVALKISNDSVFVPATEMASSFQTSSQFYRALEYIDPSKNTIWIVWFTLTDLCSVDFNNQNSSSVYLANIAKFLVNFNANAPKNSKLYFMGPLGLSQLYLNTEILNYGVKTLSDQELLTCKDIRTDGKNSDTFTHYLRSLCPNLFKLSEDKIQGLASHIQILRAGIKKIVAEYAAKKENFHKVRYLDFIDSYKIIPEDLHIDCLHLSHSGHLRLAEALKLNL